MANELNSVAVDHSQILAAREQRAALRNELLMLYAVPVVSISLNIPGAIKTNHLIRLAFRQAVTEFIELVDNNDFTIIEERRYCPLTGPFALLAVAADPLKLKRLGVMIETQSSLARLYDIDVFSASDVQISRQQLNLPLRSCLVCEQPAIICMREQHHTAAELAAAVTRRLAEVGELKRDLLPQPVWQLVSWALEAMLLEVACTPAPGLVDRCNSGAHTDMDFFHFMQSSSALIRPILRCADTGWKHFDEPQALLGLLRRIGRHGEQTMFAATGGVNTQKGLLFLLGILVAAAAACWRRQALGDIDNVFKCTAQICQGLVARELKILPSTEPKGRTAGERLFLVHGITGIRGEIEQGLPSISQVGLPALEAALSAGLSLNDALVHTLICLMQVVEDTTVLNRQGLRGLQFVQQQAMAAMAQGGMLTTSGKAAILSMDQQFIAERLSPGGSADLVAATYFMYLVQTKAASVNVITNFED